MFIAHIVALHFQTATPIRSSRKLQCPTYRTIFKANESLLKGNYFDRTDTSCLQYKLLSEKVIISIDCCLFELRQDYFFTDENSNLQLTLLCFDILETL